MSLRRKLFLVFAITVFVCVSAVAWIIAGLTRRAFERQDEQRTAALVTQFQREYDQRASDLARRTESIASSEAVTRIALSLGQVPDSDGYLNEAAALAESYRLPFLEFVDSDGQILSSAQAPARFGYPEASVPNLASVDGKAPFLKDEDLPNGNALGIFAVRSARKSDRPVYVIGGEKLDRDFLSSLELFSGMHAAIYQATPSAFSAERLTNAAPNWSSIDLLKPLIAKVQSSGHESSALIHWSNDSADDETLVAIPLKGQADATLAVLLVSDSRRPYVELNRHIESAALIVGGAGILVAILLSNWVAGRVTRPIEQLAAAAREVSGGDLSTKVEIQSSGEIGDLANAFNRMTADLLQQKNRLVQAERVAAWRELARRLAHELKNPLFPLQLTIENLIRAREQSPQMFDEIFPESAATLLSELNNLKEIINRFGEFSKMPQPVLQQTDLNDLLEGVVRVFEAQLTAGKIRCRVDLARPLPLIPADPQLLHRAISNLVLNALDAMPDGGTLTIRTRSVDDSVTVEVGDTGSGLTVEECQRIFTPYYTSKQHGTGLGLAIVQSVVSDHQARISVHSESGRGTTFLIEFPLTLDKIQTTTGSQSSNAPAQQRI